MKTKTRKTREREKNRKSCLFNKQQKYKSKKVKKSSLVIFLGFSWLKHLGELSHQVF
jgi:cytoskeletal protein RodZ